MTLDELIHKKELEAQHLREQMPEFERRGSKQYYNHELFLTERFIKELQLVKRGRGDGGDVSI